MSQHELNEIAVSLEDANKMVKIGEALRRLHENEDFKTIVLDQYFKEEPARCVIMLGRLQHDTKACERIHNDLTAIGLFQSFLQTINQGYHEALRSISSLNEAQVEIEREMQQQGE
jgi:hypothetical protein